MNDARSRVGWTRVALAGIVVARALLVGAAVGVLVAAAHQARIAAALAGGAVVAGMVWRSRRVWSIERVALWIEEHDPTLLYALVTAVDARYPSFGAPPYAGSLLRRAAVRALWPAMVALAAAVAVLRVWPDGRIAAFGRGRGQASMASRLAPLVARIMPPEYSHRPARDVRDPSSVADLVGSFVTLTGPGDTTGLRAMIGNRVLPVTAAGTGRWQLSAEMPATAVVIRLTDRGYDRSIVFSPIADAPPTVELVAPARDSTIRVAEGTIPLQARAADDIGLADGYFEVIVTAGEEESGGVRGRTVAIGRTSFANVRTGSLAGGLVLEGLRLTPGDVVSIRAIVRDGNTVNGPGVGTSDTRTFRLATKDEYDSTAVDREAVTVLDSTYMTQRMIVIETQALLTRMARRPSVARDTVKRVSARLAGRQEVLKAKVSQLLYGANDGGPPGEAMPAVEHVLFDTAYHAMSDAALSLEIAAPREALPRELVALAALDSVRKLQRRLYLRGQPAPIVINVPRVRMTGTDQPDVGPLAPAVPTDTVSRRLAAELEAIGRGSLHGPGVLDSLAVMQAAAYGVSVPLAAALGDASRALTEGRDARSALAQARRIVSGAARVEMTGADP